jgi:predicted  nucleic acid-binding Zn-ribbon protein
MKKSLPTLLRLDGLVLTRKGLELAGNPSRNGGFDDLDKEIQKLRRRLPPGVLSRYDRLARRYADPVAILTGDVCQGCEQEISRPIAVRADRSREVFQCEHCGRLVFAQHQAPDYVT